MFEEFGKQFTDEETILRAWQRECIGDTIGRLMNYWGNGERQRALDELGGGEPAHRQDASFGTNIGFYVGFDEVQRHFVDEYQQSCQAQAQAFREAGLAAEAGVGMTATHSCTTPLVYIANDGQTARYMCYDLGMSGKGKPDGTAECFHEIGLLFVELILEGDSFKIWHVVEEHDFTMESGRDYNDVPTVITDPADPSFRNFGDPTVKKDVYNNIYGWEYLYYDMPKPYKTYDEEQGYGPKGKIGRKFYERIF